MDAGGDRILHSSNTAVIREIYDSEYSPESFEVELDRALEAGCSMVVIEPTQLGDETARWITVGNYLHKTAVVSGLGAIVTSLVWNKHPLVYMPLGTLSFLCTGLYTASWQFDPCVKYQIENDPRKLNKVLSVWSGITASSPVVLVRQDDTRKKLIHCTVTLIASAICGYRLYSSLK